MEVTVYIPVYNGGEMIRKAIESVTDANILVFDDQSTDNTERIVRDYDVKYIKPPKRLGLKKSIEVILDEIDTEYCLFLSHDDYLSDGFINNCLKRFTPQTGIVAGEIVSVNGKERETDVIPGTYQRQWLIDNYYRYFIPSTMVFGMARTKDVKEASRYVNHFVENKTQNWDAIYKERVRHDNYDEIYASHFIDKYEDIIVDESKYYKKALPIEHYQNRKESERLQALMTKRQRNTHTALVYRTIYQDRGWDYSHMDSYFNAEAIRNGILKTPTVGTIKELTKRILKWIKNLL